MNVQSSMTDEQLAMAYIGGNAAAFDLVLARNQQKIFSYILFVVHDRETADDVFQDTFVKVVMRLQQGRYVPSGKFAAWVMRIAHNVIMDHYRDLHGEGLVDSAANSDMGDSDSMELSEGNVESRYVNEQVYSDVRHMMNMLRFFQDLSFKEIAEATNVSINTALGRMRYAVFNLRRMAKSYGVSLQLEQ